MKVVAISSRAGASRLSKKSAGRRHSTGAQAVFEALRHSIIVLEVDPGSPIDEAELCRKFKVSRTPVREALVRLASEALVELYPNRGAIVAPLQFSDVVDHYEAMDVFQPIVCRLAAIRNTPEDMATMKELLATARQAVEQNDGDGMIRSNYELHAAIARACHNRCLERAFTQMLVHKLRIAQASMKRALRSKEMEFSKRFAGTVKMCEKMVAAIAIGDGTAAARAAAEFNDFVRNQAIKSMTPNLTDQINGSTSRALCQMLGPARGVR